MTPKRKIYRVGIIRRNYSTGIGKLFQRTTVGADDATQEASDALDRMLLSATPENRLSTIKTRAAKYVGTVGLADEIRWVNERLAGANGAADMADTFAMLALERALDVLDTRKYLDELLALRRADVGRSRGIVASAQARAKLPSAKLLSQQIEGLTASTVWNRGEAVAHVASKYGVTTRAVNLRLKRAGGTT